MLLKSLIEDEKKSNRNLYSSGPYWSNKNKRTVLEINKKGLNDFRGMSAGIGSSFADSLIYDIRNEFNLKGRMVGKLFLLPFLNVIFNTQLKITRKHIESFLKNQAIVYKNNENVLNLLKKYKFENTTGFGCIQKFEYLDKEYSTHYLVMADRINNLSTSFKFNELNSFFEVGGGFGANIHFLITNFPNIKKFIYLDTVPNIYVGTEYLRFHYKEKVRDYLSLKNLDEINFANNNDLEILCIPPWEIEKLNVKIDHFHNAASFVEMPENVIKNYCKYIKKFETKEVSLVSYDNYNPKTTFNPEDLNNFFEKKLNISWKEALIKDYNRKNIYLTSN
tara:strand:+ start:454 stop:1458 length:1005 start_codon:yes stop_codon:yes gene_type:complete